MASEAIKTRAVYGFYFRWGGADGWIATRLWRDIVGYLHSFQCELRGRLRFSQSTQKKCIPINDLEEVLPMKKAIVALASVACMWSSFAQSAPSVPEITKQIVRSVTGYANAISCPGVKVEPKQIDALVPYKSIDDRLDAKYAVLWTGDIGCAGGSGTVGTNLSIVTVSTGDSYVVDPLQSSPVIQFESPVRGVERIVGNTRDSLILEGVEYGSNDPNCCPSIKVRFTLRVDEKGNWKTVEKKTMPVKK